MPANIFSRAWPAPTIDAVMENVMKIQISILALLLTGISLPTLAEQPMASMAMEGKSMQSTHQGTGKVVSVDKPKLTVKIAHEAIKSLGWPGMTMDFKVAKAALLDGIKAGDAVTFDLGKDAGTGKWVITRIVPKGIKPTMAQ